MPPNIYLYKEREILHMPFVQKKKTTTKNNNNNNNNNKKANITVHMYSGSSNW